MSKVVNLNKVKINGKISITKDKDIIKNKRSLPEMTGLFKEKRLAQKMAEIANSSGNSSLSELGIVSRNREQLRADIQNIRNVIRTANTVISNKHVLVDAIIGYESEAKIGKKSVKTYKRDENGFVIRDASGEPITETVEGEGIVSAKLKPIKYTNNITLNKQSISEVLNETKKIVLQKTKEFRTKRQELTIKPRNGKGRFSDIQFPVLGTGNTGYTTPVGVHTRGGLFRGAQVLKKSGDALFMNKPTPSGADHYVGVEIECYTKCSKKTLALAMVCIDESIFNYVNIKDDGSLRSPSGYTSHEICIQAKESEIKSVLATVCKALSEHSGMVNDACGLHVHLDMRNRNRDDAYWNLLTAQDIFYSMQAPNREQNQYSKRRVSRSETMPTPNPNASGNERYWGVNYHSYAKFKTIEIRVHSGSVDFRKISNWVDLLTKVVGSTKRIKQKPKNIDAFAKAFEIDKPLVDYIKERVELFKANPTLQETA